MNIKVVLNKKLHKLPQDSCKNLTGVIQALHLIFKEKLPKKFQIQYQSDPETKKYSSIYTDEEYQAIIKNKTTLKLYIVESLQPDSQAIQNTTSITDSQQGTQKDNADEQYLLLTSTIKKNAENNTQLVQDIQNEQNLNATNFSIDQSMGPDTFQRSIKEQKNEEISITKIDESQNQLQNEQDFKKSIEEKYNQSKTNQEYKFPKKEEIVTIADIDDKNSEQQPQQQQYQDFKQEQQQEFQQQIEEFEIKQQQQQQKEITHNLEEQKKEDIEQQEQEQQQQNQILLNSKNNYQEDPLYGCIDCQGDNKDCKRCEGKGFLTNNDNIIKLINQIVDYKLQRILQAQNMEQQFPEIHDDFTCNECQTTPIIGVRYQSSKFKNYNICSICEKTTQHEHDFIKIKKAVYNEKQQQIQNKKPNFKGQIKDFFKNLIPDQNQHLHKEEQIQKQQQKQQEKSIPVKKNNYKAQFVSNPQAIITTKVGQAYNWKVTLRNNGEHKWPESIRIHCIQGIYQGFAEKVCSISPQESYEIDLNLNSLNKEQALQCNGKQMVGWRLGYLDENKNIQYFGPKINYEIQIIQDELEKQKQSTGISCKEANSEILSQNKEVLEKAEKLKEIFQGEIKQYVDFMQQSNQTETPIEELIEVYFQFVQNQQQ